MKYRIVIVNYGKGASILSLLDQLSRQTLLPGSVCVIDNSPVAAALPRDISWSAYPFPVEVRYAPENLGYPKACNLGARGGDWEWVALVNPDIEIGSADFFSDLIARCSKVPRLGCAGVAQHNPDGSYELVARRFPTIRAILGKRIPFLGRHVFRRAVETYLEGYANGFNHESTPFPVDWLQSSFLLIPRNSWQACGGLSERYFVFMADTDFGLRCRRHGLDSWFFPDVKIHADGIRSSHGGLMDVLRKRTIRIHLFDAAKYFLGGSRSN
jgi:GT2 family glycosyltransferase